MDRSHGRIVSRIRSTLSRTPLYRPLRFLYNRIFLLGAKRTVQIDGVSVQFATPTFKIVEDFETLSERELLRSFLSMIHEGDVIWDVGANVGLYTLFAARTVGNRGIVEAFEPETKTRSLLARNVAMNRVHNVIVFDCALDSEDRTRNLYSSISPNPGTHSLVQRTDYPVKRRGLSVVTSRGDSLVQTGRALGPNLVKIDVEGAEVNVLRGMGKLLHSPTLRGILVEVHPNILPILGQNPADVESFLHTAGLMVMKRVSRGGEFHLFASRK